MDPARLTALAALWRHPRSPRSALDAFRERRATRLVRHSYDRVPYYRELFDRHAIRPERIRTIADLATIPITRKRDLQPRPPSDLVARGIDPARLIARRTSGSSGQPFTIRRSWIEERLLGAFRWRALHAMGLRATDRHAEIEELQPEDPSDDQRLHRAVQALGLYRQARIHALAATDEILRALRHFRPDVVTGYAGVIARVAQTMRPGTEVPRPRFVAVHSDTLTPRMRAQIETGFAAPVYQMYDSNEFNLIAWQCVATGALHTCDDSTVVEVLVDGRPAAPGERGEVVLTALHSLAMPFIRYGLGDLVIQGEPACDCGAPFGTIRAVEGRMFDYFPLPDGRVVHPYEIIAILGEAAPWISEFELVQERLDLLRLRLVAATAPSPAQMSALENAVGAFVGREVRFRAEVVEELRREPNAKLLVCRSLVASAYDDIGSSRP